jgi:hypothetical protein
MSRTLLKKQGAKRRKNSRHTPPFVFCECSTLIRPTGHRAENAKDLLAWIRKVEPGVIYHHTHQFFMKATVEAPEYPNDFAVWAAEVLEERALAEKLASLDLYAFDNIEDIRKGLIRTLKAYLDSHPEPRRARKGDSFFFNDTLTLVFPLDPPVSTLSEFVRELAVVGTSSIYFHFFEARMRLERPTDDFSAWLETSLGYASAADRIRTLDPYHYSLEGLREDILFILNHYTKAGG